MKKILVFCFLIVVGLNTTIVSMRSVEHGISLRNIFKLSLANYETPGGNYGDQFCPGSVPEHVTYTCTRTTTVGSGENSSWNASGGVSAGYGVWGANISGGGGSSNSSNSTTVTIASWTATGVNCVPRYSPDVCTSHYPC